MKTWWRKVVSYFQKRIPEWTKKLEGHTADDSDAMVANRMFGGRK